MGLIDHLAVREGLPSYGKREEAPEPSTEAGIAEPYEDDPLASARGTVLGVLLGAAVWALIVWLLV